MRVRIVDRAAGPGTTARALAVHARTMEFGEQIGITRALIDAGLEVEALNLWAGGRRAARVPIRRIGEGLSPFPFPLILPQDIHEHLLIERLNRPWRQRSSDRSRSRASRRTSRASARCWPADGAEETVEAGYLAGCDGASSTVPPQIGIGFPGGTYLGYLLVADVDATGPAVDGSSARWISRARISRLCFRSRHKGRVRLIGILRARFAIRIAR